MNQDSTRSSEEKAKELLNKMTLEEKVVQLCGLMPMNLLGKDGFSEEKMKQLLGKGIGQISALAMFGSSGGPDQVAAAVNSIQSFLVQNTRLGIPAIFHNEALNGFVGPEATTYPTPLGLGASWEPELIEEMAENISLQMKAVGMRQALSPVLDIARDPRWGRIHETYGEDPCLSSALGAAYVKGLQGKSLKEGVIATAKHFLGYGLTEGGLNTTATHLGDRELYEVFARPFEAAIRKGGMESIMNSYSEIDGVPAGSSYKILTKLLREKLGFQGFVVSDYMTISWLVSKFGTAKDLQEAGTQALKAGLDVELPNPEGYGENLLNAVNEGKIAEKLVDRSVERVLRGKFKLGLFDDPYVEEDKVQASFNSGAQGQLANKLAKKSIVLLKNDQDLLPLSKKLDKLALIGPTSDSVRLLFGNYTFPASVELSRAMVLQPEGEAASLMGALDDSEEDPDPETQQALMEAMEEVLAAESTDAYIKDHWPAKSVLESVQEKVSPSTEVLHAKGCGITGESEEGFPEAIKAVDEADVAVAVMGDKSGWIKSTTGEGKDRTSLNLPGVQGKLLKEIQATGTPVVLVLVNGRPLSVKWAEENVPAILETWYPGQGGGEAIGSILFGEENPGGKLPLTIPRNSGQIPTYHYHKKGSGYRRGEGELFSDYTDMSSEPLYHFGHGLSYTQFEYDKLEIKPTEVETGGSVRIACEVENTGETAGDEVVQLYAAYRGPKVTRPVRQLVGFKRVTLEAAKRVRVDFKLDMNQLSFLDGEMNLSLEPGELKLLIGAGSDDIRLEGVVDIKGEKIEPERRNSFWAEAKTEPL